MINDGRLLAVGLEVEAESAGVVVMLLATGAATSVTGMVTVYGGPNAPCTGIMTSKVAAG